MQSTVCWDSMPQLDSPFVHGARWNPSLTSTLPNEFYFPRTHPHVSNLHIIPEDPESLQESPVAKLISNLAKSELGKLNLKSTTRLFLLEMGSCFTSGVLVSCLKLSNWLFMQIGSNYSPSIWGENNEATKAQGCRPKHLAALSSCPNTLSLFQEPQTPAACGWGLLDGGYWFTDDFLNFYFVFLCCCLQDFWELLSKTESGNVLSRGFLETVRACSRQSQSEAWKRDLETESREDGVATISV